MMRSEARESAHILRAGVSPKGFKIDEADEVG